MVEFGKMVISGSSFQEFSKAFTSVVRLLPHEMAKDLRAIMRSYAVRVGVDGTYQRMNGRTVSEIIAESRPEDVEPIASGEVDGTRYRLFDSLHPRNNEDQCTIKPVTELCAIELSCSTPDQFSVSLSRVLQLLPQDVGKRLRLVFQSYFARYGIEGAYERLSNRTVSQIFAEYQTEETGQESP
jgi:hypothetical protein